MTTVPAAATRGSLGATMIVLLCGRGCMRRAAAEWAELRQGPTNGACVRGILDFHGQPSASVAR